MAAKEMLLEGRKVTKHGTVHRGGRQILHVQIQRVHIRYLATLGMLNFYQGAKPHSGPTTLHTAEIFH